MPWKLSEIIIDDGYTKNTVDGNQKILESDVN